MLKFYLTIIFLSIGIIGYSQGVKKNTLSVPQYRETDVHDLLIKVQTAPEDTGKVWQIYKIATVYWYRKTRLSDLDTCILYAQNAKQLSLKISFTEGYEEASFLLCKAFVEQGKLNEARNQLKGLKGNQKIRLLLVIGEYYTFLSGQLKENLNKGYPFILQALHESEVQNSAHWKEESQILLGKYFFAIGNIPKGRSYFMMVIDHYRKQGMKAEEARWWSELAIYTPMSTETLSDKVSCFDRAIAIYKQIQDKPNEAYTLSDKARLFGFYFKLDEAIACSLQSLKLIREAGIKKTYNIYYDLSSYYNLKGDLKRALSYAISSLNNMDSLKDEVRKGLALVMLGHIYSNLGQFQVGLQYYEKSFQQIGRYGSRQLYITALDYTWVLLTQRQYSKAKSFLQKIEKESPPVGINDKETLLAAWDNYYDATGNTVMAEKYYLRMIDADKIAEKENVMLKTTSVTGIKAYSFISQFYIEQKQYKKAEPYLKKFGSFEGSSGLYQSQLTLLRGKADSAAGNYVVALKSFELHRKINDSIYNAANSRQLADMRVKYETRQKEKDIMLLQKESQLQQRRISQSNQLRNFTLFAVLMLFVILGIGYNRYRLKQYSYRLLELKQTKINEQNVSLNTLNTRQQKLLEEKEWLVKEIHHRVKNNLQIVISLLNSQSSYLDNDVALAAIKESQHRMYSISLIHQILYQSENMASLNMAGYIKELADYLRGSLISAGRVNVNFELSAIIMNVNQAIPVGLILNEALTNAIKYAFNNKGKGNITISFLENHPGHVTLSVIDDGPGFPVNFDLENCQSLGMNLIKGLTDQLEGSFDISRDNGKTSLSVAFSLNIATDQHETAIPQL